MQLHLKREDLYLIYIFLGISFSILLNAVFNSNGFISPDSSNYLSLAQNILNGDGYIIPSDRAQPFAIWPVGYSSMIAGVSFITGASVYYASKIVNVLFIAGIFICLRMYYKKETYLVALVFTWASYLVISFYTWTETFFIFALVFFCSGLYKCFSKNKPQFKDYLLLFCSLFLLIFSRYIGAFGIGLVGLFALYSFIKKLYLRGSLLLVLTTIPIIILAYVLYTNFIITGYPTGMPRIPAPESHLELFISLISAFFYELSVLVYSGKSEVYLLFIGQLLVFFWCKHKMGLKKSTLTQKDTGFEKTLFIVGCTYLFFVILMRWLSHFDPFSYRLIGPGTCLLYIAGIGYGIKKEIFKTNWVRKYLITISIISLVMNGGYLLVKRYKNGITYNEMISNLNTETKHIPKGASVLFNNIHLNYLRLDLNMYRPYFKPYFSEQETWENLLKRIKKNENTLYINTNTDEIYIPERFHQSILNLYSNLPKNSGYIPYHYETR